MNSPRYRNWKPLRRRSLVAAFVQALLWFARRFMPQPSLGAQAYIEGARKMALKADGLTPQPPSTISIEAFHIGETAAWCIRAPGVSERKALLYLQGGGYILGSPATTHRDLLWRLSAACDCTVVAIDYGLVPEHRYPVACEQALAAWRWLLDRHPPASLALAGDSAGGNLALSIALQLRDQGLPLPAALCLLSPETDLTASGESVRSNAGTDHFIPPAAIAMIGALYANEASLNHPYISPVFGNYQGFPPTLLQVSSAEVFLDDSRRIAAKLSEAGVPVLLDVWDGLPHVWHGFAGLLPEARAAIEDLGRFVRSHLRG